MGKNLPTQKELEAIPIINWIKFMENEYDGNCGEPSYFLIGEDADNGFLEYKTFCSGLNQTFVDVTKEEYEKIKAGEYNYSTYPLRPADCTDESKANSLNEQGIGHNDQSIMLEPAVVVLTMGHTKVRIPQGRFKQFAEWYLEEQKIKK